MADVVDLRAQRRSFGRLFLPSAGAVLMLTLSIASIFEVVSGSTSWSSIGLMAAIVATTLWLIGDLAKSYGYVPIARVTCSPESVTVKPMPFGGVKTMVTKQPIEVRLTHQSSFLGSTFLYQFAQGDVRATAVSPAPLREPDLDVLSAALETVHTTLDVQVRSLNRRNSRSDED